jgi:hypothetical protein
MAVSRDVILNLLSRLTEDRTPASPPPSPPILAIEPVADCLRYDQLLRSHARAA